MYASVLCGRCGGTAGTGGINRSAGGAGGGSCVLAVGAIGQESRASAAGVSFTNRTLKAEWAARYGHTSMIDAAGAIYVIGGTNGTTDYRDVWVSTDGGVQPDSVRRMVGGSTKWVLRG